MAERHLLTISDLNKLIRLEPSTGRLYWRPRGVEFFKKAGNTSRAAVQKCWNKRWAGAEAFLVVMPNGYKQGTLFCRHFYAHRIVYALYHGRWPEGEIDHIDGDRGNNRPSNLRDVDRSTNQKNVKLRADNSTGKAGVRYKPERGKWQARLACGGRERHLGYFQTFEMACAARAEAELENGYHSNHGRRA